VQNNIGPEVKIKENLRRRYNESPHQLRKESRLEFGQNGHLWKSILFLSLSTYHEPEVQVLSTVENHALDAQGLAQVFGRFGFSCKISA
jgi:hypothetical protein